MNYNLEKFQKGLDELQITLSEEQINRFMKYYEMLIEKNKVMNLTAITEFDEVIEKHFLDSISLIKVKNLNSKNTGVEKFILNGVEIKEKRTPKPTQSQFWRFLNSRFIF